MSIANGASQCVKKAKNLSLLGNSEQGTGMEGIGMEGIGKKYFGKL